MCKQLNSPQDGCISVLQCFWIFKPKFSNKIVLGKSLFKIKIYFFKLKCLLKGLTHLGKSCQIYPNGRYAKMLRAFY